MSVADFVSASATLPFRRKVTNRTRHLLVKSLETGRASVPQNPLAAVTGIKVSTEAFACYSLFPV